MNGEPSTHDVLMSAFVAVEGAHAFSAFLPSIFTIRAFASRNPGATKAIRDGEIIGTAFAVGLGAVVSALIGSKLPVTFSIVTSMVMVSVYEYALRTANDGQAVQIPAPQQAPVQIIEAKAWR
jgi:hypothetical protein